MHALAKTLTFKGFLLLLLILAGFVLVATLWWQRPAAPRLAPAIASTTDRPMPQASTEPILPIPTLPKSDPAKVALGEMLFRDPRISKDNRLACISCHHLDRGGEDGLPHSPKTGGSMTRMHTPSIFNVSLNFQLFWDGRKKTLEEHIETPRETQTEWREVLAKLRNDPEYQAAFARAYPQQGMSEATLKHAVVTFENSLLTPGARFDRYLLGEENAITEQEKAGYRLFKSYGCAACHQGVNVGGNMFQKIGIMRDYFIDRKTTDADLGRYNVTKQEADKYVFRVPSLRNVAITPPYFHNGSIPTLRDAINEMAKYQLGREIPEQEVELIIAFLHTLTGEYRGKVLSGGQNQ